MPILQGDPVYTGPERRRHRVFVTQNTEYHCRDDVCVAVRRLKDGQFLDHHPALGRRMTGAIRFADDGEVLSYSPRGAQPHLGEVLYFSDEDADLSLQTTPLRGIERPPKAVVEQYRR